MKIHYLEYVSADVDGTCQMLTRAHGLSFGEPQAELGGARTADWGEGSLVGVRGPLRADEAPVVRPYVLVDDIKDTLASVVVAGGEVAVWRTEIPGRGFFAIYLLGGNELGLWEK